MMGPEEESRNENGEGKNDKGEGYKDKMKGIGDHPSTIAHLSTSSGVSHSILPPASSDR